MMKNQNAKIQQKNEATITQTSVLIAFLGGNTPPRSQQHPIKSAFSPCCFGKRQQ
jgi:hypothetical protein